MADYRDNVQVRRLKLLLLICAAVSLLLLFLAAFEENLTGEWRDHQKQYRAVLIERAGSDAASRAAERMDIAIRQVFLSNLDRIDRCVSCHVGIDDPQQADAPPPLSAHSGDIFTHHPLDKFGCTICHDGQGQAIHKDAAHGDVPHWPTPLLRGEAVYTRCGKCHYENDLYGAEDDLYARSGPHNPLMRDELSASVTGAGQEVSSGAASIARGKQLVLEAGCLGCHQYRGRGGTLGPDITYAGEKTAHDYDFKHVEGQHTPAQWLFEHFKNPERISPGSLMPDMSLDDQRAHHLTGYMLSLHRKDMPAQYTPVPPRRSDEPATGRQLYDMFCSACHGTDGQGSTVRVRDDSEMPRAIDAPPQLMVPSLNHPDTLAVASNDYLRHVIAHGRPGTNMIGWRDDSGGLRDEEIDRLIGYVRSWQPPGASPQRIRAARGNARAGGTMYAMNCAACHGRRGEGGIGPSLNAPSFLAIASDQYLAKTIIEGRPNTAMSSYRSFTGQQISDLLAHLRSWHMQRSDRAAVLELAEAVDSGEVSTQIGRTLYRSNCLMCHGAAGEGDLGPSINTQQFLSIVGNDYLYDTIVHGRPGTGMPAWRHLSSQDAASLVKHMRTWQTKPSRALGADTIHGDADAGRLIYSRACASCHGNDAEGAVGPQLRNAAFLRSASDAMLKHWIAYGKTGTPMLGFLTGQQGLVDLSSQQVDNVVAYLRSLERQGRSFVAKSPHGRPELGEFWYANFCASCHGTQGQGASGPSLSNPAFLGNVSDGFLMATLALGRDGTEMRPAKKSPQSILSLSSDQVNDVVAYMRSWETEPPFAKGSGRPIPHRFVIPWDLGRGQRLYESNCAGCHGINGKAELAEADLSAWAPQLNNRGFLSAATDGFLQATIVRGRSGTAMRPFGRGRQGITDLTMQEIDDIVAYIRRWAQDPASPMTIPAELTAGGEQPEANNEKRAEKGLLRMAQRPKGHASPDTRHPIPGD